MGFFIDNLTKEKKKKKLKLSVEVIDNVNIHTIGYQITFYGLTMLSNNFSLEFQSRIIL